MDANETKPWLTRHHINRDKQGNAINVTFYCRSGTQETAAAATGPKFVPMNPNQAHDLEVRAWDILRNDQ